jgi:hypothetical protein
MNAVEERELDQKIKQSLLGMALALTTALAELARAKAEYWRTAAKTNAAQDTRYQVDWEQEQNERTKRSNKTVNVVGKP